MPSPLWPFLGEDMGQSGEDMRQSGEDMRQMLAFGRRRGYASSRSANPCKHQPLREDEGDAVLRV